MLTPEEQAEVITGYQTAVRRASHQTMRARHLGASAAAVERVLCGGEVESPSLLHDLALSLPLVKSYERDLGLLGLSEDAVSLAAEDAASIIREEWTEGTPASELVPL